MSTSIRHCSINHFQTFRTSIWILLLGIALVSCGRENREIDLHVSNFTPLYRIALEEGQIWRPDAYLVRAEIPIRINDQEKINSYSSFQFLSETDRSSWLVVRIKPDSQGSYDIELLEGAYEEVRPDPNPISIEERVISSDKALSIISDLGGREFIRELGSGTKQNLILEYSKTYYEEEPMLWIGHFYTPELTANLRIKINAYTGELVEIHE